MAITDLGFIFIFLPSSLLLYYIVRDEMKEYILLIISMIFYAFGSVEAFFLLLVSMTVNICMGQAILAVVSKGGGGKSELRDCFS